MAPRRSHYRHIIGDNSDRTGSVDLSSSATPSAIPEFSPPPPPPPPPPAAAQPAPRPGVPFAEYTVEHFLQQPGHDDLPRLNPRRPKNTYWFGTDPCVGKSVSDIIKGYFVEPHHNWTAVPADIVETWFKCFAQKWHWDISINQEVKTKFREKAKHRVNNIVSDWKRKWEEKGDEGKPSYISSDVWTGLTKYWTDPRAQVVAAKCSASRNTIAPDGLPAVTPHTSGQMPFAGRRLRMANGGELPPMTKVFEVTHKKKDGSFVDARAEKIYNDTMAKIAERETQLSQQLSPGGSSVQSTAGLTLAQMDEIYEEVAPKKKNRILGYGSIQDTSVASSSAPPMFDDASTLRAELAAREKEIQNLRADYDKRLSGYDVLFDFLSETNPELAALRRRNQGASTSGTRVEETDPRQEEVERSTDEELFGRFNINMD